MKPFLYLIVFVLCVACAFLVGAVQIQKAIQFRMQKEIASLHVSAALPQGADQRIINRLRTERDEANLSLSTMTMAACKFTGQLHCLQSGATK